MYHTCQYAVAYFEHMWNYVGDGTPSIWSQLQSREPDFVLKFMRDGISDKEVQELPLDYHRILQETYSKEFKHYVSAKLGLV